MNCLQFTERGTAVNEGVDFANILRFIVFQNCALVYLYTRVFLMVLLHVQMYPCKGNRTTYNYCYCIFLSIIQIMFWSEIDSPIAFRPYFKRRMYKSIHSFGYNIWGQTDRIHISCFSSLSA
jgi:hypothetical protein